MYEVFFWIFIGIVIGLVLSWIIFLDIMKYAIESGQVKIKKNDVWYPNE